MASEFSIYTDESDRRGDYFSNFYGGVLVRSRDLKMCVDQLNDTKQTHNLFGEIKWQKVTANYLQKYVAMMDRFFDLIEADRAKVRIMFTNNQYVPQGLSSEQRKSEYHLLYYQFLKHAFGLTYATRGDDTIGPVRIRLNLDQMPASHEESARFKAYLVGLNNNPQMRAAGVTFNPQQIAEVDSHDHVLLQCVDIVLGAMVFRLNGKHLVKPEGQRMRGRKTIAKEKLYKHINRRIRAIYPGFNVGVSTGRENDASKQWSHPYRHWLMIPKNHQRDLSRAKRRK